MEGGRHIPTDPDAYDAYIERMRKAEYPMLGDGGLYLDHAGTTLYSKTLLDRFHADMMTNLYGSPHSGSPSGQRSTQEVEDVRLRLLRFFNADPDRFDLVFTANATAAIKLVADAFREQPGGFSYGYHVDSHTSLVGVREVAGVHRCFASDDEVEEWIAEQGRQVDDQDLGLFAYSAQSNMNGHRLPLDWCRRLRKTSSSSGTYTLLDAAALVSTSPLHLDNAEVAPDFTALSLYKIFGFPDLGALIVRKDAAGLFSNRRYFGGGTVDVVVCLKEQWHAKKAGALHERLEDGTLPIHSILALKAALQTHEELYGSLERISKHTTDLANRLYGGLSSLKHGNGKRVCTIHKNAASMYGDARTQGPVVAFNMQTSQNTWVSNAEVEKLASVKNIHLRTGGVCNPGGVATALGLAPWEMRENFSAGYRCGSDDDILNGKPTGIIRVSLGAMSTRSDVEKFIEFVDEFFVHKTTRPPKRSAVCDVRDNTFHIESLSVYPIKSCGGFKIPAGTPWEIRPEGLSWDREWCVVHQGTGKALSQKQHPRMALVRPHLDFRAGVLRIGVIGRLDQITVPLSKDPALYVSSDFRDRDTSVCGEAVKTLTYVSPAVAEFFTNSLGVPCTLARFTSNGSRHSKAHLQRTTQPPEKPRPILLSNESPILTISRSSLNRLNEAIEATGGKAAHTSVFRANIVLGETPRTSPACEQAWAEDGWRSMQVGGRHGPKLEFLGGCRRCQMVCINQENAEKNTEPFTTLAKIRRFDGRVLFGVHTALVRGDGAGTSPMIKVGDLVETCGGTGDDGARCNPATEVGDVNKSH